MLESKLEDVAHKNRKCKYPNGVFKEATHKSAHILELFKATIEGMTSRNSALKDQWSRLEHAAKLKGKEVEFLKKDTQ